MLSEKNSNLQLQSLTSRLLWVANERGKIVNDSTDSFFLVAVLGRNSCEVYIYCKELLRYCNGVEAVPPFTYSTKHNVIHQHTEEMLTPVHHWH